MRYLLDTNTCVRYLNGLETIRRRLRAVDLEKVAVCSVVKAELFYGAMRSDNPDLAWAKAQRFLRVFESLPFDDIAGLTEHCDVSAPFVGKIREELAQKGIVNLSSERVDRKGRRIETANIGTQPKSRQDKSTSSITPQPYQELRMSAALVKTQETSRYLEAENQHLRSSAPFVTASDSVVI